MSFTLVFALLLPLQAPSDAPATDAPSSPAVVAESSSPSPPPAPDAKPAGLDPLTTGAVQVGTGVATCCVGSCVTIPCNFVPIAGPLASTAIIGLLIGSAETVVGDAVGQQRAPLLWPALTSVGILFVGGLASVGASFAVGTGLPQIGLGLDVSALLVAYAVPVAINLTAIAAAVIAPAIVYAITAVDKEPGDTGGLGQPGILEPLDPTGARAKRAAGTPDAAPTAPSSSPSPPPPSSSPSSAY